MATLPQILVNGTTADANDVMDDFTEIYSNIDETNVAAGNKTGSGKFVLQTAPTVTTLTVSTGNLCVTTGNVGVGTNSPTSPNSRDRYANINAASVGAGALPGLSLTAGSTFSTNQSWEVLLGNAGGTETSFAINSGTRNILSLRNGYASGFYYSTPSSPSGRDVVVGISAESVGAGALPGFTLKAGSTYTTNQSWEILLGNAGGTETLFGIGSAGTTVLGIKNSGNVGIVSGAHINYDGVTSAGDTYTLESSANVLDTYVGGTLRLRLNSSGIDTPTIKTPTITSGATISSGDLGITAGNATLTSGLFSQTYSAASGGTLVGITTSTTNTLTAAMGIALTAISTIAPPTGIDFTLTGGLGGATALKFTNTTETNASGFKFANFNANQLSAAAIGAYQGKVPIVVGGVAYYMPVYA